MGKKGYNVNTFYIHQISLQTLFFKSSYSEHTTGNQLLVTIKSKMSIDCFKLKLSAYVCRFDSVKRITQTVSTHWSTDMQTERGREYRQFTKLIYRICSECVGQSGRLPGRPSDMPVIWYQNDTFLLSGAFLFRRMWFFRFFTKPHQISTRLHHRAPSRLLSAKFSQGLQSEHLISSP